MAKKYLLEIWVDSWDGSLYVILRKFVSSCPEALFAHRTLPMSDCCCCAVDDDDGAASTPLDRTEDGGGIHSCPDNGNCKAPLGMSTGGLIYVNPEGFRGDPIPLNSAKQIR